MRTLLEEDLVIESTLILIKKMVGVDLKLCEHFTGIKDSIKGKYFNVELNEKVSESKEYVKLIQVSKKYKIFNIEQNGLKRLAIFPNINPEFFTK